MSLGPYKMCFDLPVDFDFCSWSKEFVSTCICTLYMKRARCIVSKLYALFWSSDSQPQVVQEIEKLMLKVQNKENDIFTHMIHVLWE